MQEEKLFILKIKMLIKTGNDLLNFIQRLRDEAHRFAINTHRSKRAKSSVQSVFDEIKGIDPKEKGFIASFWNYTKVKSASLEQLKQIKTIPEKKLKDIYEFFNG